MSTLRIVNIHEQKLSDEYIVKRATQLTSKILEHQNRGCKHCQKIIREIYGEQTFD